MFRRCDGGVWGKVLDGCLFQWGVGRLGKVVRIGDLMLVRGWLFDYGVKALVISETIVRS